MKIRLPVFVVFFFVATARAEDARLEAARQALESGLPQVAIYKLQQISGQRPAKEDLEAADLLLGRALISAGRYAESVAVLKEISPANPAADFWLAEAFAALGQPEKALPLYHSLSGDPQRAGPAAIGAARMLVALRRVPEAAGILTEYLKKNPEANNAALELAGILINAGDAAGALKSLADLPAATPEQQQLADYLGARALMISGEFQPAEEKLKAIEDPPAALASGIALASAECCLQRKDTDAAEKILEKFIEENSRLPGLPEVFAALDRVYAAESEASSTELRKWSEDSKTIIRSALAQFYLARNEARSGRSDKSRQLYANFLTRYPGHALTDQTLLELSSSYLAGGDATQALAFAQKGRNPRLDFLQGRALSALGNYQDAAGKFLQASIEPSIETEALTNSAICGLLADIPDAKNPAIQKLRGRGDSQKILERIFFLEALQQASQRKSGAAGLLREIAESGSPWASQARLALAEWDNLQLDITGAQRELRRISTGDPIQKERADYLAVFLADTGDADSESRTGGLAGAFLKDHPQSPFESEVRMKLGEMLYRRGDYLGAYGELNTVADKFPDSPLAEKAAFLSAQAMSRSLSPDAMERAIEIYNEVVKSGGSLALRARLSQAMLFYVLKRPKDALGVFDNILASNPDAELRSMTLIEKGETLFALGPQDANNYRLAISAWKEIVADPAAPKTWSHQALAKMGAANEKLGNTDAALDCYYSVFSQDQKGEPEYFWYYKAGFDAGRLFESQKLWKEAIAVYDKIASIDGPRAAEARERINKLRLENFIWEN